MKDSFKSRQSKSCNASSKEENANISLLSDLQHLNPLMSRESTMKLPKEKRQHQKKKKSTKPNRMIPTQKIAAMKMETAKKSPQPKRTVQHKRKPMKKHLNNNDLLDLFYRKSFDHLSQNSSSRAAQKKLKDTLDTYLLVSSCDHINMIYLT